MSNKLNILYIWDADYPWDVRVEKICEALTNNGHQVHIASRNLKKLPVKECLNGVNIHRIESYRNDKLNYLLSFPLFFSPVWKGFIDNIIKNNGIDLIIVRDLPMAIAGIWAGKRFNIPVVFDMAEDYVALLKGIWKRHKYKGINLVLRNPFIAKVVEKYVFANIDHILVVVEEAKNVVASRGVPNEKISIVCNTPELTKLEFNNNKHVTGEVGGRIRKSYSVIYTGGIQKGRGIQTVIDAIPAIKKIIPNILFVIVGDGYATSYFKEMVREKGVDDCVLWTGWIPHEELYSYIHDSKIGVIPHFSNEHVNSTIPNKLFDYMALGLPVLVSNALPLERIVREEKCGLSYESGDESALQQALLEIYKSETAFGKNGKEAVFRSYNWKSDEKVLLRVIDGVRK